jgi:sortase (surface protein transpeptidase)
MPARLDNVEGGDAIIVFDTSKIDVKQMSDKEILDELNVSQ